MALVDWTKEQPEGATGGNVPSRTLVQNDLFVDTFYRSIELNSTHDHVKRYFGYGS